MNQEQENAAEDFYQKSIVNGEHTNKGNIKLNYVDMLKLIHYYAEKKTRDLKTELDEMFKSRVAKLNETNDKQLQKIVRLEKAQEKEVNDLLKNQIGLTDILNKERAKILKPNARM